MLWCKLNICTVRNTDISHNIGILQNELNSAQPCIKSKAAFEIQALGIKGKAATGKLLVLLSDNDPSVRWRSIAALGYIGVFTEEIKEKIYLALKDQNEHVRYNAIFAMFRMRFQPSEIKDGELIPIAGYHFSDKDLEAYYVGLEDTVPNNQYKALLHLDPTLINKEETYYRTKYEKKFIELLESKDIKVKSMALFRLTDLIGEEKAKKQIPLYDLKLKEAYSVFNAN